MNSFGAVTGTLGTAGTYTINSSQISVNSGTGAEADIQIVIANGAATATIANNNPGRGFTAGDQLTIPGNLVGGSSPANDLVVTVSSVSDSGVGIFSNFSDQFSLSQTVSGATMDSLRVLGLEDASAGSVVATTTDWVDEKNPPVKIKYDAVNQRFQFTVERNILGTGTNSNFNSFSVLAPMQRLRILII